MTAMEIFLQTLVSKGAWTGGKPTDTALALALVQLGSLLQLQLQLQIQITNCLLFFMVKVQFRGPKLYKKEGALFQEESYLPRTFRSSSLNWDSFHLINIVFWWQIFFRKHGKSTPQRSARPPCFDHDVTMQMHKSSQPITRCKAWQPRAGNAVDRFWDWLSCRCNGCRMAKSYR